MTHEEIAELFIRAAETDRRLPDTARPAKLKSQSLPFVHTFADLNGWGSERLEEERAAFWDERSTRLRAEAISEWERANDLITMVADESQRRCLLHWAVAKAGGRPFSRWCRDEEHIHEMTGTRRKDRAIASISIGFARNGLQNNDILVSGMLPVGPEITDIPVNMDDDAPTLSWMADGAFSPIGIPELRDFSWADKRNEARRQREKKRRQEERT